MSNHTKWRFANTLIGLMHYRPLGKITVKNICDWCGEKRQTFYYHFQDKYDLVTWIYYQDAQNIIDQYADESWDNVIKKIFENMNARKNFYRNAFSVSGQNSLIDLLVAHDIRIYRNKLQSYAGDDALWEELNFAIEYHAYACAHIVKKWLTSDVSISPADMSRRMYKNLPIILKEYS